MLGDTAAHSLFLYIYLCLFVGEVRFQNKSPPHNSGYNWITCSPLSHDKLFFAEPLSELL